MKITLKSLSAIAVLSFSLAFATGMSATIMYQEYKTLQPFMAVEMVVDDLVSDAGTETFDFS